ncbi:Crp/Fnr family transcriptional regulator [Anaerotignum sp. MB30-C6]|uniref:Crp/Fnr family transcriptional regulator n=1 Tax=Anaerotignum sp. MB30-C6 TaxID=3070814 RepID=UPI0027DC9605|nr:Crp/Fnr family transcriptional regulator [Anaerotignum sp. MB30-C6]WMI81131.1 Crp/Fnr family transcriptional regulator [Anaerotignum sp. MB30-C6]
MVPNKIEMLPFFQSLSEEEKTFFQKNLKVIEFKEGDLIYSPAKGSLGMVQVLKGAVRAYIISDEGKKATIFRLREGEFCMLTMACAMSQITFDVEVEASEDCQLLLLPTEVFTKVEQQNIYVKNFSLELMMERMSSLIEGVQQMIFLNLEQRIASYLLDESSQRKNDTIYLTQEQIAENIGSAREAVSRTLKRMKEKDLISVGRGCIHILNKKELYEMLS